MKRLLISCTCFMLCIHGFIYSQEENNTNKPDERIKVNKEYDDHGNLIRYDSVYSYSSSRPNLKMEAMDSILKNRMRDRKKLFEDFFEFYNLNIDRDSTITKKKI